jgi:hypothetical protein
MPQEARSSSRGRTSRARPERALHASDTNSPHSHSSSEVDASAVEPKAAEAALGNFFESVFESASKKSSDEQSRGAYSTVSKMAASKKSNRSSSGPREKNLKAKEQLGSFFDDAKSEKQPVEDEDQSRGAYSTASKMKKSSSRRRSRSRNGKDRLPSRKPSSKESSTDKNAEASGLGSFINDQTPANVEKDIEVQSAQVGGVSPRRSKSRSGRDRLSSRKKREAPQPAGSGKNGAVSKEELVALFRTVSSPTDYMMTDEMRHEVGTVENWTSRIADEEKVLAYSKDKTRTSDMKDTRARSSDEVDIDREHGSSKGTMDSVDRSISTLIKSVKARSSLSTSAAPVSDERKTQTTSRTSQRQSQSSNRSPPRNQTRSHSRSRRSSNRDRSKSRSRINIDDSTSDAVKSPRPKSRSRINTEESTSEKSPRQKSRSSKQSDESGSDAIKSPPKSGSRRHSVESGVDAKKSPRPRSGSRRNSVESNSEAMKMYKQSNRESGPSSKDSGRRHKDPKDAPGQKSSRRLADDEGVSRPQRQQSSRRLVEESPRRQPSSRRLAEEPPRRQPSSRRLVAKDSPKKSGRSANEETEGIPRRSKHSSSKRLSNEDPSTHSRSRRLSNEERSSHSSSRRLSNEDPSTHSRSRRLSNEDPSSPTSSAKIETHKLSNHQRQPQKVVIDAPISEEEVEQPANGFDQDIFSLYTWSSARTDTQRIQKERKILKDSLRDSPLFRVFPQSCIQTL